MADVADYAVVALFGLLVAFGELATRYRDAPTRAIANLSAWGYMALNAVAAVSALALIRLYDVNLDMTDAEERRWAQVLLAGFGAMAFFRTSFFIARVGGQDLGMGPSGVLQSLLKVADRGIDRHRARARAGEVTKAMEGVSFEKAQTSLPAYCFALMQNVTQEEQAAVADQVVAKLKVANMPDATRGLALGLALMNIVGEGVLIAAVKSLGDEIKTGG